jgi:hypothetical protein
MKTFEVRRTIPYPGQFKVIKWESDEENENESHDANDKGKKRKPGRTEF